MKNRSGRSKAPLAVALILVAVTATSLAMPKRTMGHVTHAAMGGSWTAAAAYDSTGRDSSGMGRDTTGRDTTGRDTVRDH